MPASNQLPVRSKHWEQHMSGMPRCTPHILLRVFPALCCTRGSGGAGLGRLTDWWTYGSAWRGVQ